MNRQVKNDSGRERCVGGRGKRWGRGLVVFAKLEKRWREMKLCGRRRGFHWPGGVWSAINECCAAVGGICRSLL